MVVSGVVGLIAVACGTDAESASRSPPAVPRGALAPSAVAALDAIHADPDFGLDDLEPVAVLGRSEDPRVAWPLVDLLQFQGASPSLSGAIDQLTGLGTKKWVVYADALLEWDVPAPPGYLDWKRSTYVGREPGWEPFFDESADVDWRQVSWGGIARDGLPALTDAPIVDGVDGDWLPDEDIVLGVEVGEHARAYPLRIMEVHELANDTLDGRRIAVAFCTLCGTGTAYYLDRTPPGVNTLEMGTSGLLLRSNKLMYDVETESLFEQLLGVAVTGPLGARGVELERISVVTTTWGAWQSAHPATTILTADAGTGRVYTGHFLGDRDDGGPIFPTGPRDGRLPAQEPVFGVAPEGRSPVAFPVAEARAELLADRTVAAGGVVVEFEAGGLVARDRGSGAMIAGHESFWFAWSQFRPDTILWSPPSR